MTSNNPTAVDDAFAPDILGTDGSTDEPAVIYPLVSDSGNQRVLREWLSDHESYRAVDEETSLRDAEFDLCIVDQQGLRQHQDELASVKSEARPALIPVLLLLSENQSEIIEADQGDIADNVFQATVDEIITLPIRQAELEWRIQALLRLRNQSLTVQEQMDRLRQFRQFVEAAGHAIFVTDTDGTIEYVNPAFEEMTGYSREDVIGETPEILNSGKMPAEYYEQLWESISAGEVWKSEIVDRRKDGEIYTAYQTIAPITDDDGTVRAFVAVQTDITDRKELQDRLKRHRDIVQRLDDPIMLQDEAGNFELINEAVAEFAGVPEEKLLGNDESLFMDDETAATIEQKKAEVLETETPATYNISPTFENSDKEATFRTSRYPYYNDDDELAGTLAICRDVTDLEERTRQLRVIDNILRHNLRNSLTVIHGFADQIRADTSGDIADAAETITAHADELLSTGEKSRAITDLLSEEPEYKDVDISATVQNIAAEVTTAHPEVEIDVTVPDRAVASTTTKIGEAIEELVQNAIVHNDHDVPAVDIHVSADDECVEIRIVDNGPGMAGMDRDVLVTGQAVEALYHGSGLGLWLVYWIVKRSDGSIEVSELDPRGTEVAITLPRSESELD